MNPSELLSHEIANMGNQVDKCCKGMPASCQDLKLTEQAMTPRQILEHLCEVYQAAITTSQGGTHEWGSYKLPDTTWDALTAESAKLRSQAAELLVSVGTDETIKLGFDFLVGHDSYHVGQLVLARLKCEPEWDSHSIYRK